MSENTIKYGVCSEPKGSDHTWGDIPEKSVKFREHRDSKMGKKEMGHPS
jgi:hypothetical protein